MDDANLFKMFTSFMKTYQSSANAEEEIQDQHSSDVDSLASRGTCHILSLATFLYNLAT